MKKVFLAIVFSSLFACHTSGDATGLIPDLLTLLTREKREAEMLTLKTEYAKACGDVETEETAEQVHFFSQEEVTKKFVYCRGEALSLMDTVIKRAIDTGRTADEFIAITIVRLATCEFRRCHADSKDIYAPRSKDDANFTEAALTYAQYVFLCRETLSPVCGGYERTVMDSAWTKMMAVDSDKKTRVMAAALIIGTAEGFEEKLPPVI